MTVGRLDIMEELMIFELGCEEQNEIFQAT